MHKVPIPLLTALLLFSYVVQVAEAGPWNPRKRSFENRTPSPPRKRSCSRVESHNPGSWAERDVTMASSLDGLTDSSDEGDSMETNFDAAEWEGPDSLERSRLVETELPLPPHSISDYAYRSTHDLLGWTKKLGDRPAVFLINRVVGSLMEWPQVAQHQALPEFIIDVHEVLDGIIEQDPYHRPSLLARVYRRLERVDPELAWEAVFGQDAAINPLTDPRLQSFHQIEAHLISIWQDVCQGGNLRLHQRALLFLLLIMRVLGADWEGNVPDLRTAQDFIFTLIQTGDILTSRVTRPVLAFGIGYYLETLYPFILSGREDASIAAFVMRDGIRSPQALDFILDVPETFPVTIMDSLQLTLYGERPILADASLFFWGFLNAHGHCGLIRAATLPFLKRQTARQLSPQCFSLITNPDRVDFSQIISWLPDQVFKGIRCPLTGRNAASITPKQLEYYAQDNPAACTILDVSTLSHLAIGSIRQACLFTYLQHANPYQPLGILWSFVPSGIFEKLDHHHTDLALIARRIISEWDWIPSEGKKSLLGTPLLGQLLMVLLAESNNSQS